MSSFLRDPAPRAIQLLAAGHRNVQTVSGSRKATGKVVYTDNFAAGDNIKIGDVTFSAVAADAGDNEFVIGADLGASLDALVAVLNASEDLVVASATYANVNDTTLTITVDEVGEQGNLFFFLASTGVSTAVEGGKSADILDVAHNSVFKVITDDGSNEALDLPLGLADGQEITVYFAEKGTGSNAVISGVFAGGTTMTLDTAGDFARLMWLGAEWVALVNSSATIA